jgi:hypothetical protein
MEFTQGCRILTKPAFAAGKVTVLVVKLPPDAMPVAKTLKPDERLVVDKIL